MPHKPYRQVRVRNVAILCHLKSARMLGYQAKTDREIKYIWAFGLKTSGRHYRTQSLLERPSRPCVYAIGTCEDFGVNYWDRTKSAANASNLSGAEIESTNRTGQ